MGAFTEKDITNIDKLPESYLSSHIRDIVKYLPDLLIFDVSVSYLNYRNLQDLADTTIEEDVE